MTLPEKFKFKMNTSKYVGVDNIEYTAELNDGAYDISYYSSKGIYNNFSHAIFYTQKRVEKGHWIIIEEELPVEFKFTVDKLLYTACLDTGNEYLIQWEDTAGHEYCCHYSVDQIKNFIKVKKWIMIEDEVIPTKVVEVCNGVDADGNPFNFTDDMLKLGQVVQTRNLDMYVVVNHDDNIALADITGGWVSNPTIINENEHIEFDIINVYEPNSPYRAFQFNTYQGKLIWSANHSKKTQAEQDIADLEESIKLDTEKLVVLKSQITK